ncbi:unnamed protein product [Brassicogethes aeneus]|uniref:Immunoglobulin domain-containing protein n=1 Tax=Brassicogethes aeneus TaxID=1431903 RepID=A0A9P0B3H7_BRAAE|nr:unnamed protein product [Brassicogethes aeneus]
MKFYCKNSGQYPLVFYLLQIIIVSVTTVWSVKINRLLVPEVARPGFPIILDCDYTLEGKDDGLVVKWFFNDLPLPVYQWIPTIHKKPQVLGILKGRLNLNYSASKDMHTEHRALHIIQPGPDLSGNYTCLVSTFNNEDQKTKGMLVLVPAKSFELSQENTGDGMLQVICYAEGVFPKPNMTLLMGNSEVNDSMVSVEQRAGLFNIRMVAEVPSLRAPEEFACELRVPQANYTVSKKVIYYPVSSAVSDSHNVILNFIMALFINYVFFIG